MGKLIDNIKKKAELKKYNEARQIYLKKFICNIGRIVEEEDKIICYVDQESIDNYKEKLSIYKFRLNGMNTYYEKSRVIIEKYKLNKPVYYIFDGIEFSTGVEITSLWSNVIFRNCTFNKNIGITYGDKITFENNNYLDDCDVYFFGNCFFNADRVNKLTFINDNFVNSSYLKDYSCYVPRFGMKIDAKEIEFINTKVDAESTASINIKAERTKIENSELKANEVYVDSQSINVKDSSIIAQNGVMIENENRDFVGNVQAPIVFYNGTDLANGTINTYKINEDEVTLKEARIELIEKLRNLSYYCQQLNDNRVQGIQDKLNNQAVVKVLKQR